MKSLFSEDYICTCNYLTYGPLNIKISRIRPLLAVAGLM